MGFYSDRPFNLGETLLGTDDDGNLVNEHWEGAIFWFEDIDRTSSRIRTGRKRLTGRPIGACIIRNTSGVTLLGKRVARLERDATTAREFLGRADGYADTLREKGIVIIDGDLDSNGVAANDLFWGIFAGPCTVLTPEAGSAFSGNIDAHSPLIAATAATTQTSVAGRVSNVTGTGIENVLNLVGWSLDARTTGETNSDLTINAAIRGFN